MTGEEEAIRAAGNPLAREEWRFVERFWTSDAAEEEFARSFFFGQEETEALRELIRGREEYYRRYRRGNLERLRSAAEVIAARVAPGGSILEVGCGFGQLSFARSQTVMTKSQGLSITASRPCGACPVQVKP